MSVLDIIGRDRFLKEFSNKVDLLIRNLHDDEKVRDYIRRSALNRLDTFISGQNFEGKFEDLIQNNV